MDYYWLDFVDFLKRPAVVETFVDVLVCAVPIWAAVMIGLLVGWSWKPRWTGIIFIGLRSKLRFAWTMPPGFGAHRLWLAFTALSAFSVGRKVWSDFRGRKRKNSGDSPRALVEESTSAPTTAILGSAQSLGSNSDEISNATLGADHDIVSEKDLEHLLYLLDGKNGVMAWQSMMERSTSNLSYQAWRYEPETGPAVYRTRTVFEDATPELARDFFWDDEFRLKWDSMLTHFKILEEFPHNGTNIVHWIKKFPFFCSDREYIIGRRIWEAGKAYYCVTKGLQYPALQRRDKPRRVDLYFSSWVIRPVLSRKGDGQASACEVILVHYEDMGIPKDVAKLGVRHGMWGTVKKLHSGFRSYQSVRKSEVSLSRCAMMAMITTRLSFDLTEDHSDLISSNDDMARREEGMVSGPRRGKEGGGIDWKWVVIGGTVALICGLHGGMIGRGLLLSGGQRLARRR